MVEKVQLPTACWNIPHKCLKEREFEPGCEDQQIIFFTKEREMSTQRICPMLFPQELYGKPFKFT